MKKGRGKNNGILPNSLRIISSCLKTVSANATTVASNVRSAGASVAASISSSTEDDKDQVTWAGFDRLELGPSVFKQVLLLGYQTGFQVLDVDDASHFIELVSKRDGAVSFLQMQPFPSKSDDHEGFRSSHPLLLVVAGEDTNNLNVDQNHCNVGGLGRDSNIESHSGKCPNSATAVRFYSLRSHCYVHALRFRSAVRMVRCSPRIVAVGLATQIYCIDALTLESKFSVLTYPVPQLAGQGTIGVNVGYGPMAVGPRWLAYASNNPLLSNTSRLSPQILTPSPGVSPSTSPSGGSLVARYAMEQLAAGMITLGDMGYKTLSKCCQELLPDGSNSPVQSSSGWKVGRLSGTDVDNAGMVVVKDFISRAVISQFKAHTSPISALCFDPNGTLLVTASVYGNNINIFRIMPSCAQSGSGVQEYDWSSSHAHLYKLHRGITSAMIHDICFSDYSQWIAIVSSKGTCHVFVLSPFGGDSGFQSLASMGQEPSMYPVLSIPWWSTSCIMNQHSAPPPPPVFLSVVSRIKYSSFGWLNTVGTATGSAAGKVFVPSGAVAAVFHNSMKTFQHFDSRSNALEHLLVYTPSGHVVQHELLPSIGLEPGEVGSRSRSTSFVQMQEDDLKVKVEPVQWWDVCRRSDWPEREECIVGNNDGLVAAAMIQHKSDCTGNFSMDFLHINDDTNEKKTVKTYSLKPHERFHFYLSNAEVQINSGRLPIWQKSKICFNVMDCPRLNKDDDGEFEIEKVPLHELEIKRKDLLPVFDHFHTVKSGWNDRAIAVGRYFNPSSLDLHQAEGKVTQETVICHSKPASLSSTESSECGSSRRMEQLLDLDPMNGEKSYIPTCQTLNEFYHERRGGIIVESAADQNSLTNVSSRPENLKTVDAHANNFIENGLPSSESCLPPVRRIFAGEAPTLNTNEAVDGSLLTAEAYNSGISIPEGTHALPTPGNAVDFGLCLQEDHWKALEEDHWKALDLDGCHGPTEVMTDDVDSGSCRCDREKPEEGGDKDAFLGGIFAFSEEG